jgi:hypothetical protein
MLLKVLKGKTSNYRKKVAAYMSFRSARAIIPLLVFIARVTEAD